jgi:uncharacterized protein (DUF362 family)
VTPPAYRVRAVRCDHLASDDEVYRSLRRATAPLDAAWDRLKHAKRITIKFNQCGEPGKQVCLAGQFQELVSEKVARAVLRLLREETTANIACIDTVFGAEDTGTLERYMTLLKVLREYDVPVLNGNVPPFRVCRVPGGGAIFRQYLLHSSVVETDAFVSVSKMKSHRYTGVTMCLKNLFGLLPMEPYGRNRSYFHHFIRLPNVLVDLGQIASPSLNIVDALVAQTGAEWGGEGLICNTLIAGDQVTATDVCGALLMGHDPRSDWPEEPFGSDRNALLIGEETRFGTAQLTDIDFRSEVTPPIGHFYRNEGMPLPRQIRIRRSMCQQALWYRDHREDFSQYTHEYVLLQDSQVIWHSTCSTLGQARRTLAGSKQDSGVLFKYADPDEAEGEHFEVYERTLEALDGLEQKEDAGT